MAKKASKTKYISKGQRPSVAKKWRTPHTDVMEVAARKWKAFIQGRRVYFTIDNPNTADRKAKTIRVLGKDLYGDFRNYDSFHVIR